MVGVHRIYCHSVNFQCVSIPGIETLKRKPMVVIPILVKLSTYKIYVSYIFIYLLSGEDEQGKEAPITNHEYFYIDSRMNVAKHDRVGKLIIVGLNRRDVTRWK